MHQQIKQKSNISKSFFSGVIYDLHQETKTHTHVHHLFLYSHGFSNGYVAVMINIAPRDLPCFHTGTVVLKIFMPAVQIHYSTKCWWNCKWKRIKEYYRLITCRYKSTQVADWTEGSGAQSCVLLITKNSVLVHVYASVSEFVEIQKPKTHKNKSFMCQSTFLIIFSIFSPKAAIVDQGSHMIS